MPRRAKATLDTSDPEGLGATLVRYLDWLREHHFSERTIEGRLERLRELVNWAAEREVRRPGEVSRVLLERYQRHLAYYRKADGQPLSIVTQHGRLGVVRGFFKWLAKHHYLPHNPASELELPRVGRRLPKHVLTVSEVERVLAVPDAGTPWGLRDRAILETLYSTGMRRQELINLTLDCLDRERGTVMIRWGKGRKDRVVPMGERALYWIERYLAEVRPGFVDQCRNADHGLLFVWKQGRKLNRQSLGNRVRRYVRESGVGKPGGCHLLRHTCATLMLEGGADLRFVQELLGHAELATTQIYTQVSIVKLKEVHTATHPGALLGRRSPSAPTLAPARAQARAPQA